MATASPDPRKRGPYAKSEETRERILTAAFELAGELGIQQVTVSRIAERARVAVGNIHYHFGSRGDLFHELVDRVIGGLASEIIGAVEGTEGGFFAREEASLRAYLAFVHRNPAWVRLTEEVRNHEPELYRKGLALWLDMFRDGLQAGIAAGELRPMDADGREAIAHLLLGARYFLDQMIEGVGGRDYPGDETVVRTYLQFIRRGLDQETP